jgi:hypothetical protein
MRMVLKWELGLEARKRCHPQRKTRRDEPVTLGAAPSRGCLFRHRGWNTHCLHFLLSGRPGADSGDCRAAVSGAPVESRVHSSDESGRPAARPGQHKGKMTMAEQPHETVWRLSTAGVAARCLHLVADLGVADRIADGPYRSPTWPIPAQSRPMRWTACCACSQRTESSRN